VAQAALPALSRLALTRGLTARVQLTLIVLGSFFVRGVTSALHPTPVYFPDEYIYTAIARSLGAGHAPAVRDQAAHFPALLAPILAAPFQSLFDPQTAYRLTQLENSLLMSLAAVPVYLLARRLSLSARYALACAVFAVALPDLAYASYTLADPVAYPFALAAIAAGVAALDRPGRRRQLLFLGFAFLATFARVQYVVLPAAYVVAALAVDRRAAFKTQRLPFVLLGLPIVAGAAVGASRVLGYYSHVIDLHVGGALLHWAATDLFLLAIASGVVLVPGALVALARPRGRTELGFSVLVATFAAGLLLEAALYASNGSARFQERYLFSLLPLVPVAFGLYLKHGRPGRLPVALLAGILLIVSARTPLSGYSAADGKTDSPTLWAVFELEHIGTANGALVVAVLIAVAAATAALVCRRGGGRYAVLAVIGLLAVASAAAVADDAASSRSIRSGYLPANPSWVDAFGLRDVTLVQTVGSPPDRSVEQLYWNRSITREARLGNALPTDVYSAPRIHPAADGTLVGVGNVLFQNYAAAASFQNATLLARAAGFSLWSSDTAPKLSFLERGRYSDGWLSRTGRVTVWPDAAGNTRGTLSFGMSLPRSAPEPVTIHFGKTSYRIYPGQLTLVSYTLDARGVWSLPFHSDGGGVRDLRPVSVRSTVPQLRRTGAPVSRETASF
jgi:hypothetical protein